jgi:hypothetical protein
MHKIQIGVLTSGRWHQFGDRWRNAGHLSEKAFAELQPLWKQALHAAAAPLEAAQKASTERRQALIAEAEQLGAAPVLRVDAVKALQQTWQAEAQSCRWTGALSKKCGRLSASLLTRPSIAKQLHASNMPLHP